VPRRAEAAHDRFEALAVVDHAVRLLEHHPERKRLERFDARPRARAVCLGERRERLELALDQVDARIGVEVVVDVCVPMRRGRRREERDAHMSCRSGLRASASSLSAFSLSSTLFAQSSDGALFRRT
jgi:hypothetical protein